MTRLRFIRTLSVTALAPIVSVTPVSAGQIDWPSAHGDVIVDHQPIQSGGPAADTEFLNMIGDPSWQLLADDFVLSTSNVARRLVWWGFYNLDNPPAEETMRVRFYDARPSDGLPGEVLFEESFWNPSRIATGEVIGVGTLPAEYLYQVDLAMPFSLDAGVPYWLEITQIGDLDTAFRWEFAFTDQNGHSFSNNFVPDWVPTVSEVDLSFQLLSIPEPASSAFFVFGWIVVLQRHRRR